MVENNQEYRLKYWATCSSVRLFAGITSELGTMIDWMAIYSVFFQFWPIVPSPRLPLIPSPRTFFPRSPLVPVTQHKADLNYLLPRVYGGVFFLATPQIVYSTRKLGRHSNNGNQALESKICLLVYSTKGLKRWAKLRKYDNESAWLRSFRHLPDWLFDIP